MGCVQSLNECQPEDLGRGRRPGRKTIRTSIARKQTTVGESLRFHCYAYKDKSAKVVKHELIFDTETGWPVAVVERLELDPTTGENSLNSDLRKAKNRQEIQVRPFRNAELNAYYQKTLGTKKGKKAWDQYRSASVEKRLRGLAMKPRSQYIMVDENGLVKIKLGKGKQYENTSFKLGGPKDRVSIKYLSAEELEDFQQRREGDIRKMDEMKDVLRRYGVIFPDFDAAFSRSQAREFLSYVRGNDCHVRRIEVAAEDDGIVLLTEYTPNELDIACRDYTLTHDEIYVIFHQTFSGVNGKKRLELFRRTLERMYNTEPLFLRLKRQRNSNEERMTDTGVRYLLAAVRRENPNMINADDEAFDLLTGITYQEALENDWDEDELDQIYFTFRCGSKRDRNIRLAQEGYNIGNSDQILDGQVVYPGQNVNQGIISEVDYEPYIDEGMNYQIVPEVIPQADEMTMPI